MKTDRVIFIAISLWLLMTTAVTPARSQSAFTFRIPVDVQNLHPDVDRIRFWVQLKDGQGRVMSNTFRGRNVDANRRVVTTFAIGVNPRDPHRVKSWTCILQFHNTKSNRWRKPGPDSGMPLWRRLQQGSTWVTRNGDV